VKMLGGKCWIESQPGHGTMVNVRIPLGSGGS
jgi:signal transduction histidine kinase